MNGKKGFTLIELILVVVILALLSAFVVPKLVRLAEDAKLSTMKGMQAALLAATDFTHADIVINPKSTFVNVNGRAKFDLTNGERITIRGSYPDGRWNNVFEHLVDMDEVTYITGTQDCEVDTSWCARNRTATWLSSRVNPDHAADINLDGQGFIIFPNGFNLNNEACYIYYFSPNAEGLISGGDKPFAGIVADDC